MQYRKIGFRNIEFGTNGATLLTIEQYNIWNSRLIKMQEYIKTLPDAFNNSKYPKCKRIIMCLHELLCHVIIDPSK